MRVKLLTVINTTLKINYLKNIKNINFIKIGSKALKYKNNVNGLHCWFSIYYFLILTPKYQFKILFIFLEFYKQNLKFY